ncbi:hypothetical protein F4824DRAFT_504274 [Ustulina deusta]|nr:hypothetical protein F4824DRAFT_504274 [Ustulina deusta]
MGPVKFTVAFICAYAATQLIEKKLDERPPRGQVRDCHEYRHRRHRRSRSRGRSGSHGRPRSYHDESSTTSTHTTSSRR